MRRQTFALLAAAGAAVVAVTPAACQERAEPLQVGTVAPDFELPGATRFGVLRDQVTLNDFRGKTVVLAFFFRARTRG
jgi:hypothetical protein